MDINHTSCSSSSSGMPFDVLFLCLFWILFGFRTWPKRKKQHAYSSVSIPFHFVTTNIFQCCRFVANLKSTYLQNQLSDCTTFRISWCSWTKITCNCPPTCHPLPQCLTVVNTSEVSIMRLYTSWSIRVKVGPVTPLTQIFVRLKSLISWNL